MTKGTLKLLIAEDDANIRQIIHIALEKMSGFTINIVEDGSYVLDAALADKPDMILLDYMMPNMDGPATCKALQQCAETTSIPRVFLTAKTGAKDIDSLDDCQVSAILSKPFNPISLGQEIMDIWTSIKK